MKTPPELAAILQCYREALWHVSGDLTILRKDEPQLESEVNRIIDHIDSASVAIARLANEVKKMKEVGK